MPFNTKSSQDITGIEILRFPAMGAPVKSVVLDLTDTASWPVPTDKTTNFRFLIPAGTILALSATNSGQYVKYSGGAAGTIKGILGSNIDAWVNATNSDEPAPMFFHQVVFATENIVDFTLYASALVNDLPTTLFQ